MDAVVVEREAVANEQNPVRIIGGSEHVAKPQQDQG
jgi:hypothetical protein